MMDRANAIADQDPPLGSISRTWRNVPRLVVLVIIRAYQLTISRLLPVNTCRFYPSCSHYGFQAIAKYGLIRGGGLAIWRVLRCQPFNPGGYDPVP
jgi:putative membrane protein insertion efficiency factor